MILQNINFSTRKILLFFQSDLRLSHKPALGKTLHWEKQFLHILNDLSGYISVKFVYPGRNLNHYINNARSWSVPASTCSNRRFPPFWGLRYVGTHLRESTYTTKWLVIFRRLAFSIVIGTLKVIFQFRIGKVSGIRGVYRTKFRCELFCLKYSRSALGLSLITYRLRWRK